MAVAAHQVPRRVHPLAQHHRRGQAGQRVHRVAGLHARARLAEDAVAPSGADEGDAAPESQQGRDQHRVFQREGGGRAAGAVGEDAFAAAARAHLALHEERADGPQRTGVPAPLFQARTSVGPVYVFPLIVAARDLASTERNRPA